MLGNVRPPVCPSANVFVINNSMSRSSISGRSFFFYLFREWSLFTAGDGRKELGGIQLKEGSKSSMHNFTARGGKHLLHRYLNWGKISENRFWKDQSSSSGSSEGGAQFEFKLFSDFDSPPPKKKNNDHSLTLNCSCACCVMGNY